MTVKKATLDDVAKIAYMEKICFVHPWSEKSIEDEMTKDGSVFLLAYSGEEAVGYIGMSVVLDEGYVANLAVLPNFRRQGFGKALLFNLLKEAESKKLAFVTLEVRALNQNAISLYESFGFEKAGVRKNYYKEPLEDALLLTKYF